MGKPIIDRPIATEGTKVTLTVNNEYYPALLWRRYISVLNY